MTDIRAFRPADAPALLPLVRDFFSLHREFLGTLDPLTVAEAQAAVDDMLRQPQSWIVVAEDGAAGDIVGFARWEERDGAFFGCELFVRPERRAEGIGGRLQAAMEEQVRQAGGDALFVSVVPHNRSMMAFAHKRGYDTLNTIELRKELAGPRPRRGQVDLWGISFETI